MNILFFLTPKSDVAYISEDDTLRQALEKMEHHKYSAVPIVSRTGRYVGTLTEGDLLWGIKNQFNLDLKGAERIPVTAIRRRCDNRPVKADADMEDLIGKALNQNFVPVLDDQKCFIGIITRKDIIKYFYQKCETVKEQAKNDQTGAAMVGEEIKQLEKMSGVIPFLFLSVAAVVLYITLSRMTEQQRTQIGTMMALGISKWQIRFHYLLYGAVIGAAGGILGTALGYILADQLPRLHHWFHIRSSSRSSSGSPVVIRTCRPPPITFRLKARRTEFITSEFRSKSLALALTVSLS